MQGTGAEDFDVLDASRRIGRLYRRKVDREEWSWSISTAVAPGAISGRSPTKFLALQMLADTYQVMKEIERTEQLQPGPVPVEKLSSSIR
jgi:hypothetical protein